MTDRSAFSTVSVVVPILNRARFLVPTLESIIQQNYPRVECIVVDGGSTDGTVDILKRLGGLPECSPSSPLARLSKATAR